MSKYILSLSKEYFKFSSAHFTIFNDSEVECLHGHNYRVALKIECREIENGFVIEFRQMKKIVKTLCDDFDEKVLIPADAPFLSIAKQQDQFQIQFNGAGFIKHYSIPCEDVELLAMPNITVECLAKYICDELVKKLKNVFSDDQKYDRFYQTVISVAIEVEETPGQSVSYVWEN
jgi:6-pyruvoyltetrahydropterin/6-carboxytetrahydropterin synthase